MIYCFDEYEIEPDTLELRRAGVPIKADRVSVRLLVVLLQSAGQLVTKSHLIERAWPDCAATDNVLTVAMVRLRKALGHRAGEHEVIVNMHGRGYRFVRAVTQLEGTLSPVVAPASAARVSAAPSASATVPDGLPFVGREPVMLRLRSALAEARAGRGSACLLMGEPGIGKTRAAEQLAREAVAAGVLVAWGNGLEVGDAPPLSPFRQLLHELLAAEAAAGVGPLPSTLSDELSRLSPEPVEVSARAAAKPAARHRLFEAVLEVFARVSRATPCLLILDDLHRVDAASLELLGTWIDRIARSRVLLICTMRDAESRQTVSNPDLSYVKGHRNCTRIALERLDAASVATYVRTQIDDPEGRFARAVFVKGGGNPFFMVELARQLSPGALFDPDSLTVSAAALDLVRPRLLALDRAANGVLSAAAVIGLTFELGTLALVTGHSSSALMELLDEAIASEVIRPNPDAKTTFAFGHDLLRRTLYETLEPALVRRQHLKVAQTLEQQRLGSTPVSSALRAYHLYAALPEGDLTKAAAACALAADEATHVFAFADSVRHLRHALEALALFEEANPFMRMGLLLRLALDARVSAAPEFEGAVRSLIQFARIQRAGEFMMFAGILLDLHPGFPALEGARAVLDEALSLLPPSADAQRCIALALLATAAPLAYDGSASGAQLEQALELSERTGSPHARLGARSAQLYLTGGPAHRARGPEALLEFARFFQENEHNNPFPLVMLELHRAITGLQEGELAASNAALGRAEARCRELGSRELLWHVERFQAHARLNTGADPAAFAALRALHRRAREHGIVATELLATYDEVLVLGQTALPTALYRTCIADSGEPPSVWSIKVRILAAALQHEDARLVLARVPPERLAALPCDRDHLGTLGALTRSALALGALDYVEALYPLLLAYQNQFAAHVSFFCEGSIAHLCGLIAAALGRNHVAGEHLELGRTLSVRAGLRAPS